MPASPTSAPSAAAPRPVPKPSKGESAKPADNKRDTGQAGSGDVQQKLKRLDERVTEEMARCHAQYDDDRTALSQQHGKLTKREAEIQAELDGLRPELEEFLHGEDVGAGLTPDLQRKGKRYLALLHEQSEVRLGKRLAFGATLPAGAQPLGRPVGDKLSSDSEADEDEPVDAA